MVDSDSDSDSWLFAMTPSDSDSDSDSAPLLVTLAHAAGLFRERGGEEHLVRHRQLSLSPNRCFSSDFDHFILKAHKIKKFL